MFASRRERVLAAIRASTRPLDDVELSRRSGVRPRQTVNTICHALAADGVVERLTGPHGLIVNRLVAAPNALSASMLDLDLPAPAPPQPRTARGREPSGPTASDVTSQLGERLGVELGARRISHPSGAQVGIDGVAADNSVLVQTWTATGPATPAQRAELVAEAVKLFWIGRVVTPMPRRLLICAVDPEAIAHLTPRSWQTRAIADLGVEVGTLTRL